ncbi:hypothetical protein C6503_03385 [Candidatus Poribacteria bacterium]|nr:MAG: hypothetical protein C6503_03385 [Candidatus Poribacteria bacterium]
MAKRRHFTPEFKAKVVLEAPRGESSQAEVCRRYNLENAASLFESRDKPSQNAAERIAHIEQLVGRLTVAVDIHEKALKWVSEKRDPDTQDGKSSSE